MEQTKKVISVPVKIVTLTTCYRCSPEIIEKANNLISHNKNRFDSGEYERKYKMTMENLGLNEADDFKGGKAGQANN